MAKAAFATIAMPQFGQSPGGMSRAASDALMARSTRDAAAREANLAGVNSRPQVSPSPISRVMPPEPAAAPAPTPRMDAGMPSLSSTVNQNITQQGPAPLPEAAVQNDGPASMAPLAAMAPSKPMQQPLPATGFNLNPNLGKRIYPESMNALARLGRIAY